MAIESTLPIRPFPQLAWRGLLPFRFMRAGYSRLTNNELCFKVLNRDFVRGLERLERPALSPVGQRIAEDLKRCGIAFADMGELFEASRFDELKAEFDAYAAEFTKARAGNGKLKGKEVFLDTIHKAHTFRLGDVTSEYLAAPTLAAISAEYMGLVPRYVGSSFWHTKPAPSADRQHSQLWHRDYNDRRLVKVFLYLSDVGPRNGCFEYISCSQIGGQLGKAFDAIGPDGFRAYPDQEALQAIIAGLPVIDLSAIPADARRGPNAPWRDKPARIQCTAPHRAMIFCDTFGLHRGGFVEEGYRDLVMTTFSTNFNCHKPHFAVTQEFAETLGPFMRMVFGLE
jgi:hypothetical protein